MTTISTWFENLLYGRSRRLLRLSTQLLATLAIAACASPPGAISDAGNADQILSQETCAAMPPTAVELAGRFHISPRRLDRLKSFARLTDEQLCALPQVAIGQLLDELALARAASANGAREYREMRLRDDTGQIPADGLANALGQRDRVLATQGDAGISRTTWTNLGPGNEIGGRVRSLLVDPDAPSRIWAGTASGGIWRSEDGGQTWLPGDGYSVAYSITKLAMDPGNHNTLYASTGELGMFIGAGIFRSTDRGLSWSQIASTVPGTSWGDGSWPTYLNDIAISAADSKVLLVAGHYYSGLLRSADQGQTWRQIATRKLAAGQTYAYYPAVPVVVFDPVDARRALAGTDRGSVLLGANVGLANEAWTEIAFAASASSSVTTLAYGPGAAGMVYATTSENGGTLYRSADRGQTWVSVSNPKYCGGQCWYDNSLWVDPVSPNRLVLGGVGLYRSVDSGLTWSSIDYGQNFSWIHVDHHALAMQPGYDGVSKKVMYIGSDGGVYQISDITAPAWNSSLSSSQQPAGAFQVNNLNNGLMATQFYSIGGNAGNGGILGGLQDNGSRRQSTGTDWTSVTGGDGGFVAVPATTQPVYTSYQYFQMNRVPYSSTVSYGDLICNGITDSATGYRYIWNATTQKWDTTLICGVDKQNAKSLFIAPIALDPNNDKRMYGGGQSVWMAPDVSVGDPAWRAVAAPLAPLPGYTPATYPNVSAIAITPGNSNRVLIGYSNGEVWLTVNALAVTPTWTRIFQRTTVYRSVSSISIHPQNPNRIVLSIAGTPSTGANDVVQLSTDGGATWGSIAGNLPLASAYWVTEHPAYPGWIYVGTEVGMFASENSGASWSTQNQGPAQTPVYMLQWYDSTTLLVASYGRGAWKATVSPPVAPGIPGSPAINTATLGYGSATVGFTPAAGGSGTITYTVSCSAPGQTSRIKSGAVSPLTVQGLTAAVTYSCSVTASNSYGTSAASAALSVTPLAAINAQRSALFVNASTSANKTSVVRLINADSHAAALTATAYDEAGNLLGTAGKDLGTFGAQQAATFTSAQLESALGFMPSIGTAKYSVYFSANLPDFQIINYTKDIATGKLTLSQAQIADRSTGSSATSVTRSAWFMSASTSTNKTNVLRILNTSNQVGALTATVYDEAGKPLGSANTSLGPIAAHQMLSYTSAQFESAIGFVPAAPTSKYRAVFTASLPSMELINFTKDIASGNLTLVQSQVDDRPTASAGTSTRNALMVYPAVDLSKTTVMRIINPNAAAATLTATAYGASGSQVASGVLGTIGANQILALTSSQIQAALVYSPILTATKIRLVITANLPSFEVVNDVKDTATGNLYLAQAQTDNRAASSATSATRSAYIIYPSSSTTNTTELRVINTTGSSAALTATAYDDNGSLVGANKAMGSLAANQMLSFTSAQLEALFGYAPIASARWRIVFSAALSNFELLNYANDVASGLLVLAQPQTD